MNDILKRIFPAIIDNRFPGHRVALWAFYGLTAITLWRSQHHIFAADGGAQSIATIPLDTWPTNAADSIVGIFAMWGVSQLIIGLIWLIASIRYRAMIPLLYLLFILEYVGRIWVGANKTIETAGTAPGGLINLPFVILGIVMLGLSVWPQGKKLEP